MTIRAMFKVEIQLKETADRIVHTAFNTYTKGPLFCVESTDKLYYKYPLDNIWRIIENYDFEEEE